MNNYILDEFSKKIENLEKEIKYIKELLWI